MKEREREWLLDGSPDWCDDDVVVEWSCDEFVEGGGGGSGRVGGPRVAASDEVDALEVVDNVMGREAAVR